MMGGMSGFAAMARLRLKTQDLASKRSVIRPHELGGASVKEAFDCQFLCDACGYLCDTAPACPACGSEAWIDLDYWTNAEALRAREEEARRQPPRGVQWQVRLTSLAGGVALGISGAVGLAFAGLGLGAPTLLGCGALATALTHAIGRRRFGWSIMTRRVQKPTRWRLPLPLVAADATTAAQITGRLVADGPLLRAPFSGRACIGYDIAVMFDTPGDAWPPIWVLREMRSCAFEALGRRVAADALTLALPLLPVAKPAISEAQLQRFLRERGLFLVDGSFDLFEAIVEPEAAHELLWPSLPAGAPPFIQAAEGKARRDPYR